MSVPLLLIYIRNLISLKMAIIQDFNPYHEDRIHVHVTVFDMHFIDWSQISWPLSQADMDIQYFIYSFKWTLLECVCLEWSCICIVQPCYQT